MDGREACRAAPAWRVSPAGPGGGGTVADHQAEGQHFGALLQGGVCDAFKEKPGAADADVAAYWAHAGEG